MSAHVKNRSLPSAAAILPVLLFLTACTSTLPSEAPSLGSGSETTSASATTWNQVEFVENEAPVYWAGQNQVGITTYGGHDCYDKPTTLARVNPQEATVDWELAPTGPCDIGAYTFQAQLPDGIDTAKPIVIAGLRGTESSVELPA